MQSVHVILALVLTACLVTVFCPSVTSQCFEPQGNEKIETQNNATTELQVTTFTNGSTSTWPWAIIKQAVKINVDINSENTDTTEINKTTAKVDINESSTAVEINKSTIEVEINESKTEVEINESTTDAEINKLTTDAEINESTTDAEINELSTEAEINESTTEVDLMELDDQDYEDLEVTNSNVTTTHFTGRIVGGTTVTAGSGLHNYAVYLNSVAPPNRRRCTGALITTNYILTTASCVIHSRSVTARVGTTTLTGGTALTGRAIIYPKYYSNTKDYDLALVRLDTPATLSTTVGLVKLAYKSNSDDDKDVAGRTMVVVGFGSATAGGTESLMYTNMRVLTWSRCYKLLRGYEALLPGKTQSCLDTEGGTVGLCGQEDVGSLVLYRFETDTSNTLAGIATQYSLCGTSVPNIFTRVGPFIDWIRKYVPSITTYG